MQNTFDGTDSLPLTDAVLNCVRCETKIKNGFYFQGQGPYGICCYRRIIGDISNLKLTMKGKSRPVKLCKVGLPKDCNNCILSIACEYSEATDGRK